MGLIPDPNSGADPLSTLSSVMNSVGSGANIFSTLWGMYTGGLQDKVNNEAAARNFMLQRQIFEYQKQAQDITRQREDTAVQRRVADLKAAGLSPVLAAGSAASTSAPIQVTAPQMGKVSYTSGSDRLSAGVDMMRQFDIAQSLAQLRLNAMQIKEKETDIKGKEIMNEKNAWDLKKAQDLGMSTSQDPATKAILNMSGLLNKFSEELGNVISNAWNQLFHKKK